MPPVIQVTNLSKRYRLGQIGRGTLYGDLNRWWAKVRGKPDPALKIGQGERGERDGEYIWALKDVSFEVDQGEVLGIIGKNGAGKSTLLKILSRITAPTSGEVRLKGRVGSLLEVGTGFHPELTGRENIYLNGAILGMSTQEVDRKFDEIVDFSGVEQFIDTPVKRYSSGMYVRLAFAVAAHLDPEILVVDEVLAVGDAAFQKKCLGKMDEVAKGGRTVLFVSHNMGMVRSLCNRCIHIESGLFLADGHPEFIINRYLSKSKYDNHCGGLINWSFEDAPGAGGIKLLCIKLLGSDGNPSDTFDFKSPIEINIVYEVLEIIRGMRLSVLLTTDDDITVFLASNEQYQKPEVNPGVYQAKCIIPQELLNQKRYRIKILMDIPNVKWLVNSENAHLTFHVSGGGHIGSRNPTNWPGVISPKLVWQTNFISNSNAS